MSLLLLVVFEPARGVMRVLLCAQSILTNSHTWELSCSSINILAANYGEGAQTLGNIELVGVCVCVDGESKATEKTGRTGPTQKAFSKGRKTSRVPGSLWELHAGAAQVGLCAEKLGHSVCHSRKVRGLWVEEWKRDSKAPK